MTKRTNNKAPKYTHNPDDTETKIEILRTLLIEGEKSGVADYNYENLIAELDIE